MLIPNIQHSSSLTLPIKGFEPGIYQSNFLIMLIPEIQDSSSLTLHIKGFEPEKFV